MGLEHYGIQKRLINSVTFEKGIKLEWLWCLGYIHITSITIPKSVKVIKDSCFWRTYYLTSIEFEEGSECELIESSAFGRIYALTSFTFPPNCKEVRDNAFGYCSKLERISIPASIQKFGLGTFNNAPEIKTITIDPDNQNYTVIDNSVLMSVDGLSKHEDYWPDNPSRMRKFNKYQCASR